MMTPEEAEKLNKNRRNFLKILLIGGGTVLAGKFFGSGILDFLSGPETSKDFETFKVTEDRKGLSIYDKNGEEILVIDKI